MRADAFLAEAERLPLADLEEILGNRGVVVIAPHPDDESLGCGGLIAEATARAIPVRVVVVSDGAGSHPGSRLYPPPRLKIVREGETLRAMLALGLAPDAVTFLRLPDREVPSMGEDAEQAADRIAAIAREIGAATLLVTWKHDPHGDHQAAHAIARLAQQRLPGVRLRSYPIWGWTLPARHQVDEGRPQGMRLDISRHHQAKRAAILAHASQTGDLVEDDPDGFRLEPAMIERFVTMPEIFLDDQP